MKTKKMKFIPIEGTNTSSSLWNCMDEDFVLKFTIVNQSQRRALQIGSLQYGEINFERLSDWMRFINKLDKYDDSQLKTFITGKNKSLDYGDYIISRADIEYSEDGFCIEFKEPVDLAIEEVGDKFATIKVKKLIGKHTYECYFRKNSEVATDIEIYIYDIKIIE